MKFLTFFGDSKYEVQILFTEPLRQTASTYVTDAANQTWPITHHLSHKDYARFTVFVAIFEGFPRANIALFGLVLCNDPCRKELGGFWVVFFF